jgi:RNA polymerase sigma factor (sigma-70 family)
MGSVAGLTDGELLDRFHARRGVAADLAFAVLLERHGPMVRRVCRRILGDASSADDALQATFLVLARKAESVRDRASLAAWLHGVALRVAVRARDAEARRKKHEQRCAERAKNELKFDPWDDTCAVVHEELARLPERLRNVVVLCYIEGNSYEEAARQLDCPILTVKSRLVESRRRLRRRLDRRGMAPAGAVLGTALFSEANAASAVLPPALAETIVSAATQLAANPTAAAGAIPAHIVALTQGVLLTMLWTKLKFAAAASLLCVVAWGALVSAQVFERVPAPEQAPAATAPVETIVRFTPPQTTPAQPDRLEALERKLDRLIQVLEGGQARHAAPAATASSYSVPATTPAPVVAAAPARYVNAPVQGQSFDVFTPAPVQAPAANAAAMDRITKLEQRIDRLEQRLSRLERRGSDNSNLNTLPPSNLAPTPTDAGPNNRVTSDHYSPDSAPPRTNASQSSPDQPSTPASATAPSRSIGTRF